MKNILFKILSILDNHQKKKLIFISVFLLTVTFIEIVSIGTLYQLSKVLLDANYLNQIISYEPIITITNLFNFQLSLDFFIYFLFFIFLLKFTLNFFYYFLQSTFVESVRKKLTSKLVKLYLAKEYKFFLSRNSSVLIRNITSEVGSFSLGIMNNLLILTTEFFIFLGIICLLLANDYKLVLIIFTTISAIGFSYFYITKSKSHILSLQKLKFNNLFIKSVIYLFKSIKNIKIYNSEIFHKKKNR